jgi:hypothetical protein
VSAHSWPADWTAAASCSTADRTAAAASCSTANWTTAAATTTACAAVPIRWQVSDAVDDRTGAPNEAVSTQHAAAGDDNGAPAGTTDDAANHAAATNRAAATANGTGLLGKAASASRDFPLSSGK